MTLNCYKINFRRTSRDFAELGGSKSYTNEDSDTVVTR